MGLKLAQRALSPIWCGLSERARLVLVHMSITAMDRSTPKQQAGHYFAGNKHLAQVLYGVDDPTEWQLQQVKRALSELRKAGAVTVIRPGMNGRKPVYRINAEPDQDQLC